MEGRAGLLKNDPPLDRNATNPKQMQENTAEA